MVPFTMVRSNSPYGKGETYDDEASTTPVDNTNSSRVADTHRSYAISNDRAMSAVQLLKLGSQKATSLIVSTPYV